MFDISLFSNISSVELITGILYPSLGNTSTNIKIPNTRFTTTSNVVPSKMINRFTFRVIFTTQTYKNTENIPISFTNDVYITTIFTINLPFLPRETSTIPAPPTETSVLVSSSTDTKITTTQIFLVPVLNAIRRFINT